jgi:hypothetical protein
MSNEKQRKIVRVESCTILIRFTTAHITRIVKLVMLMGSKDEREKKTNLETLKPFEQWATD